MKVTLMLADYAAECAGKLTVVGAGWTFIGPQVGPTAVAIILEVPWVEANTAHHVVVELQDPDGKPALVGPQRDTIRIESEVEVGRPPGHPTGVAFIVPDRAQLRSDAARAWPALSVGRHGER